MKTREVADQLVSMCRDGRNREAIETLYADHCTSREMPGTPNEFLEGKPAIAQKGQNWYATIEEFHGGNIGEPLVAGNHFSCTMSFDCTFKEGGRVQMEEIAVYEVQDGKIVSEQFFYSLPEQ